MPIRVQKTRQGITLFQPEDDSFDVDDIRSALSEYYLNPELERPSPVLWDLTSLDVAAISPGLLSIAKLVQGIRPPGEDRAALLISSEEAYTMAKAFQLSMQETDVHVEVFWDFRVALDWLLSDFES